jgi:hypothetical protein
MNKTLSILAAAVLTSMTLAVHAAEQKPVTPSPGQPTGTPPATPTWTVPVAQPSNITIKQKSGQTSGIATTNGKTGEEKHKLPPQRTSPIEERNIGSPGQEPLSAPAPKPIKPDSFVQIGGNPGNPWNPQDNCYVGPPPKHYRCPKGTKFKDIDPSPKVCWRCETPTD